MEMLFLFVCLFVGWFFNDNAHLQAVPTSNGTSFDFVTTENGPVCLDLYSTPQYKRDQHSDCTGEPGVWRFLKAR